MLAFSTVSQIGFMVLAVGSGAYTAAIFLMVAHAFFKGLLFLGAGSVIHGLDGEQELSRMGGLRTLMAWTFATFLVGWLAIAGVPPLSAFFAKGDVLKGAWAYSKPLWAIGVVAALLTAYYMTRLFVPRLHGRPPVPRGRGGRPALAAPHESPWVMRLPARRPRGRRRARRALGTVARPVLAPVFAGGTRHRRGPRHRRRPASTCSTATRRSAWSTARSPCSASRSPGCSGGARRAPGLTPQFLARVWYWDDAYDAVIGRPSTAFARAAAEVIDPVVIDGAVVGTATALRRSARQLRRLQNGLRPQLRAHDRHRRRAAHAYLLARIF